MSKKSKKSKRINLTNLGKPSKKMLLIFVVLTAVIGTVSILLSGASSNFKVTEYSPVESAAGSCHYPGGHTAPPTATGHCAVEGRTAAVDPKVIPLGSEICVGQFGTLVAEDTGRLVKGRHVDVFVVNQKKAFRWGHHRQIVTKGPCHYGPGPG